MSLITVIIPLYNKAAYIKKTIESVLNQTYDEYEIVVVDDGSNDDGVDVIKQNFNSPKLRIIQKENGGPSSARNRGVKEAKGKWIVFLDADDLLLPYALECFAKVSSQNAKVEYFVGNFYRISTSGDVQIGSLSNKKGILRCPFYYEATRELTETSGTVMISKKLLLEEPFDETIRRYEDAERQYRIMRKYSPYIFSIPVSIINCMSAEASKPRKDVREDFIGHMVFEGKSFWEQMCLYILALECRNVYPDSAKELYSRIYQRKDLRIAYWLMTKRNNFLRKYREKKHYQKQYDLEKLLLDKEYFV